MADAADLARTLLDLHRSRTTAVLTVQGPGVRTMVYFREGAPVWAGEGAVDRTLGRMLLRDGLLDIEKYGVVIERMSEALAQGKELRFGEVAVELGFLTRAQVAEALLEQVRRKIMDCLGCEDADLEVREAPDEVAAVPQHVLSIEPIVVRGIRLHWDDGRTGPLVAALADEKPTLRVQAAVLAERLGLGPAEMPLLASIDGARTTRALVDGSSLGADPAARLFAALVVVDALAFPSTRAAAPRPASAPRAPAAAPASGLRAPAAPARPAPPPRPVAPPAAIAKAAPPAPAPAKAAPLAPATATSKPEPPKPAPPKVAAPAAAPPPEADEPVRLSLLPLDVRKVRLEAEQQFQAGRIQLASGKTFPAARILRRAATLYPEAAEYALWAEWAEYKTMRQGDEQAARRVRLKAAAIAALQQDKQLAMGHHLLGLTLAWEGDPDTAVRFLRRAVELDPASREFKHELQAVVGKG